MEWARAAQLLAQHALPPHLDEKRQRELETLFNLYDQDANGCIDMNGECAPAPPPPLSRTDVRSSAAPLLLVPTAFS
jgi:hypothetical protein